MSLWVNWIFIQPCYPQLCTCKNKSVILFFYPTFFTAITHGPHREKPRLRGFANNKGADKPAHPRSLISTFVIRLFEVSYPGSLRAKFQISS